LPDGANDASGTNGLELGRSAASSSAGVDDAQSCRASSGRRRRCRGVGDPV